MKLLPTLVALSLLVPVAPAIAAPPLTLSALEANQAVDGFRPVARYRDGAGHAVGARFVHVKTGFTLDLLRIQSVPQAFIWVNSWPTSDKGEPHTQEHLLLGKGNRGRHVATLDSMSLADSNAYTEQRRTCYQFYTAAGPEVFYDLLQERMDALLHPDYSDSEVRREVRNFGVGKNAHGLHLEEKGTVYNEMVSSFERPWTRAFHRMATELYGPHHPLSYVSGGSPEALRTLGPDEIRAFHDANYHLGNMGLVASLPKDMPLERALARFDRMLGALEPGARPVPPKTLPAPQGAKEGEITLVGYPDENAASAGQLLFAWPATRPYETPRERLLAQLFTDAIAGDATTNLYKRFINSKTRVLDVGASDVFGYLDDDQGHPFYFGLSDVGVAHLNPAEIRRVGEVMTREFKAVAAWSEGSAELVAFNGRVRALVSATRRSLGKFVNSPPGFGFRSTGSAWIDHLNHLDEAPGFEKSLTLDADLDAIDHLLASGANPWRALIARWGLDSATPYAVAARPDPALITQGEAERQARLKAEVARLEKRYGVQDGQQALARYQADYDAESRKLKEAERSNTPSFIANPPLTRDPQLDYRVLRLEGGVPMVASTFDTMSSATVGLALSLEHVPANSLLYLSLLPTLLTQSGVIENGKPVSYEEMSKRLRNEILSLGASYDNNPRTGRYELVFKGAGTNAQESARAVEWLKLVAYAPDWRPENLPRLRDVVDSAAASWHNTMKGREEAWVNDPANAYLHQDQPLYLATDSALTMAHNAQRLRWRLRDAGTEADRQAIAGFLDALAGAPKHASRDELQALTAALGGAKTELPETLAAYVARAEGLPETARDNAREAAKDLGLCLGEVPDGSLAADWAFLCAEVRDDLLMPPATALAELEGVRRAVLNVHGARMFLIGAKAQQDALLSREVPSLLAGLDGRESPAVRYGHEPLIRARLRDRLPGAEPRFVGLVNPNTQSGVFINRAPGPTYASSDRDALMTFLASKLYGGGGAHSIFMKTWAAGLAYSNGLGSSASSGQLSYYAERCPELPETLRFVTGVLKQAEPDPSLVDYAFAQAFDDSRAAWGYESRGEAMASDLADGLTPEVVTRFRKGLLALRGDEQLAHALFERMPMVYGKVLPGLSKADPAPGALNFVIGPEKQMNAYEGYLRTIEGPEAKLERIYPRDYWMTDSAR